MFEFEAFRRQIKCQNATRLSKLIACARARDDHAAKTILRDKANVILNSQLRVNDR
jgi:hypothetical protein